jgi:c-di-GMP-binding flagellar brake protein YcgR
MTEKRKNSRINSLNLSYICLDENDVKFKQGMGRTLNISESGILLETNFPIDPEYKVLLTIGLENDLIDMKGEVIHCKSVKNGKFETGIQFFEPDEITRQTLKNFVREFKQQKE